LTFKPLVGGGWCCCWRAVVVPAGYSIRGRSDRSGSGFRAKGSSKYQPLWQRMLPLQGHHVSHHRSTAAAFGTVMITKQQTHTHKSRSMLPCLAAPVVCMYHDVCMCTSMLFMYVIPKPMLSMQAKRSRRPSHADPAQQAAWEDAALAAAWVSMVRRDIPRAARYAAAQRTGVLQVRAQTRLGVLVDECCSWDVPAAGYTKHAAD
jgi:hypothetical protein